jgi:hypothetical protein
VNDRHEPVPLRGDADKMLATMHDELPDCRFARPSKRVSQNSIAFIGLMAVWQKVVRLLEKREPILVRIVDQRIIAFLIPGRGERGVNAVTWKDADVNTP